MPPPRWFLTTLVLAFARPVVAAPVTGFVENWPGTSLSSWTGGASYSNPGTGGVGGDGDGYLVMSTPTLGRLATFSSGPEYVGDWRAAGITSIHLWLNDVDADEPLEIHVVVGSSANFWLYNPGFSPPEHAWGEFVVDLTSAASFTRIIGTGSFEDALSHADRIQIRHDVAPFVQGADLIQASVGIDHLLLADRTTATVPITWGRIKALYR